MLHLFTLAKKELNVIGKHNKVLYECSIHSNVFLAVHMIINTLNLKSLEKALHECLNVTFDIKSVHISSQCISHKNITCISKTVIFICTHDTDQPCDKSHVSLKVLICSLLVFDLCFVF